MSTGFVRTPNRPEHADYTRPITGTPFSIRRYLDGYAYPANGNTHNPTPRYLWLLILDGKTVDTTDRRSVLVAAAREPGAAEAYRA